MYPLFFRVCIPRGFSTRYHIQVNLSSSWHVSTVYTSAYSIKFPLHAAHFCIAGRSAACSNKSTSEQAAAHNCNARAARPSNAQACRQYTYRCRSRSRSTSNNSTNDGRYLSRHASSTCTLTFHLEHALPRRTHQLAQHTDRMALAVHRLSFRPRTPVTDQGHVGVRLQ